MRAMAQAAKCTSSISDSRGALEAGEMVPEKTRLREDYVRSGRALWAAACDVDA